MPSAMKAAATDRLASGLLVGRTVWRFMAKTSDKWRTPLWMVLQKFTDEGRPNPNSITRVNHKVAVLSEIRQQMILHIGAGGLKSRRQSLRKFGSEIAVILHVNPQHWYPCSTSELRHRFDQIVRGAIVVGFAVEMAAAAGRETNNG